MRKSKLRDKSFRLILVCILVWSTTLPFFKDTLTVSLNGLGEDAISTLIFFLYIGLGILVVLDIYNFFLTKILYILFIGTSLYYTVLVLIELNQETQTGFWVYMNIGFYVFISLLLSLFSQVFKEVFRRNKTTRKNQVNHMDVEVYNKEPKRKSFARFLVYSVAIVFGFIYMVYIR